MNSRELIKAALQRKTDIIPNGLGGCETEGVHIRAYRALEEALGLPVYPPRADTFMLNAVFETDVIDKMGGDIMLISSPRMCSSELRRNDGEGWYAQKLWGEDYRFPVGCRFHEREDGATVWDSAGGAVCPAGSYFFDSPAETDLSADFPTPDPEKFNPPHDFDDAWLRRLEDTAKRLYEETTYSLCLGETITDLQIAPGGMVGSMVLMLEEPDIMRELLDRCVKAGLDQIRLLDQAVGKYVDILSIAHDFGDNRGVTIGAPLWREIYKPYYNKLFQGWHKITNMKVNLHSCGSINEIIPDLIECGLDILNPVQTSANGMSAASLKAEFGDKLIFWGGAYDSQLIPRDASYDEVYKAVRTNIETFSAGGGFIFSGVHNLPPDMTPEHFKAMFDALHDVNAERGR